jgi:hypothetical protein
MRPVRPLVLVAAARSGLPRVVGERVVYAWIGVKESKDVDVTFTR